MRDMEVEAPPGTLIGSIHQDYIFAFQQWFSVMNDGGETVLKVTKSTGNFFSPEVDFKVNNTKCHVPNLCMHGLLKVILGKIPLYNNVML